GSDGEDRTRGGVGARPEVRAPRSGGGGHATADVRARPILAHSLAPARVPRAHEPGLADDRGDPEGHGPADIIVEVPQRSGDRLLPAEDGAARLRGDERPEADPA